MPPLPSDAPPEYGKGGLPSPVDVRDWVADEDTLARLAGAGSALPSFRLGERPPVTNQGSTPQCVAYSTGVEQNWQDNREHGHFFDWNEALFFFRIGGTSAGAFMRAALDELIYDGYPLADATGAHLHRAESYVLVPKSVTAIKNAIVAAGGVLGVMPWFDNWTEGLGPLAILPTPSGGSSGHAVWFIGWDEYGLLGQNSWGTFWGDNGLFRMPWWIAIDRVWEFWSTLDDQTTSKLDRELVVNGPGVNIRHTPPDPGNDSNIFANSRKDGIYRRSTGNRIGPLSYRFKFLWWSDTPEGRFAICRGFRRRLAIRKSLMHFV